MLMANNTLSNREKGFYFKYSFFWKSVDFQQKPSFKITNKSVYFVFLVSNNGEPEVKITFSFIIMGNPCVLVYHIHHFHKVFFINVDTTKGTRII